MLCGHVASLGDGLAGASDAGHHTGSNRAVVLSSVPGRPGYQKENGPSSTDYRRETQKQGKPSSINDGSLIRWNFVLC